MAGLFSAFQQNLVQSFAILFVMAASFQAMAVRAFLKPTRLASIRPQALSAEYFLTTTSSPINPKTESKTVGLQL